MILGSKETKDDVAQPPMNGVYPVKIHRETYNLYDTVNLGEYTGSISCTTAAGLLYCLLANLPIQH